MLFFLNLSAAIAGTDGSNNSPETAYTVTPGQTEFLSIDFSGDKDWYKITVDHTCSLLSTVINNSGYIEYHIYDQDLQKIAAPWFSTGTKTYSRKVGPGTYYIKIYEWQSVNYATSNISFRIDLIEEDPWENNDVSARAVEILPEQQISNVSIEAVNDYDWFKITVDHTCSLLSTVTNNSGYIEYHIYDQDLQKIAAPWFSTGTNTYSRKVGPGTYYINIYPWQSVNYATSNISFRIDLIEEDPWENNDVSARAVEISPGQQISNVSIEAVNDYDWFKITVDHTCSLLSTVTNNSGYIEYHIYDQDLQKIAALWFSTGTNTYSRKVGPGTYYINIYPWQSVNYATSNISFKIDLRGEDPAFLATLGKPNNSFQCNDPVNPVNGNFTQEETDINIPTKSVPLGFTRFYNSRSNYSGPLGKSWQHNYNAFLTINTADNSVTVTYPDGHANAFTYADGSYTRPAGCFEILTKNTDGTYNLLFKDQTRYVFSNQGRLTQIADKNGNITNLGYTGDHLTTVTEPTGRILQISYDEANRISQIIDPANHTFSYTYDGNNNLATVQGAVYGQVTTYNYDSSGLTSITDPNNHRQVYNVYDSLGRVIEQHDAQGNVTRYSYDSANGRTTVTDARYFDTVFYYDDKFRVTRIDYPQSVSEQYVYDADGNRTSETDKNGNTTTYTYDTMGNQLTRTDPAPFNYVTTTTYDSQNNPTRIVDASGNAVDMTYDTNGNLQTVARAVYGGSAITSFTYNDFGQVIGITDPNGKTSTITYDQYGNRESLIDPLGNKTTYTYDILGRKLTEITPRGNVPGANPADFTWTYTYDENGNVLTVTDPLGHVTINTYDLKGNRTSVTDPRNNTTTFTYDENGKLATSKNALGQTTTYSYDPSGNLASISDPKGRITTYSYDFLERLTSVTYPDNSSETYTLDGNGNMTSKVDRNGNTTSFEYDSLNRLVKITDAENGVTTYTYDPVGNKTSVTDPRGKTTSFTYDPSSRLLSTTDPLNHTTVYSYDLAGNQLSMTNAKGATWSYAYDDANRVVATTDPLGHSTSNTYDQAGNIISTTDANGKTTTYEYDSLDRLISVTNPLNHITAYGYDENGNLISATDANNHTTLYSYDELNRQKTIKNALNETLETTYDNAGNLEQATKPDGTQITYTYDVNNRLTEIRADGQTQATLSYDPGGRRTSMSDPGGTTSYSYDRVDRLTSATRNGDTVSYSYDASGNRTGITYPSGLQVSYYFNDINLPETVHDSVYQATFSYDEIGNILQEMLPNGINVNYEYDAKGRLSKVEHVKDSTVLTSSSYTFDNTVNPLTLTNEQNQTIQYFYDDIYQLTRAEYPDGTSTDYTYDPAGNRTNANGQSYTYDAANRLTSVGDTACSYDPNGNLTVVGADKTYQYDYANRLVQFADGTDSVQYSYDGDGNRTGMTVAGAVYGNYSYTYDIAAGIPQLLVERSDTAGTNQYLWAGRLFERMGPEGQVFYLQDGLGSTSVVASVYGQPLNSYWYDAFGTPHTIAENVYNPFQFTGAMHDPSGLIFLNARYYDPFTGRFITQDTVTGDLLNPLSQNLYIYCGNNPVAYVDPSGHIRVCQIQDRAQSAADWLNNINEIYIGGPLNQIASGDYTPIENIALNNSPAVNMIEGIRGRTIFTGKDLSNEERQARIDNFNTMMAEGMIFMSVGGKSPVKGAGKMPVNPKKVDAKYLKRNDIDPHTIKKDILGKNAEISKYDTYIDKNGELWLQKKGAKEFIPTYEKIGR